MEDTHNIKEDLESATVKVFGCTDTQANASIRDKMLSVTKSFIRFIVEQ